jgi:hypothetical protein
MSGDIRQQGRSAGWRRLAAILGGLAIAAVTTVVTWAATKGVTTFDRAVTARDPVTVSVQSNPSLAAGFAGTSVDLRLPARAQPGSGPGQGIDVRCPSAGEAEFRALSVDLDAPDTRAQRLVPQRRG